MIAAYKKDDNQKFIELKRMQMEYDAKRVRLIKNYEAINSAKKVDLEEIPLPMGDDAGARTSSEQTELTVDKLKTQKFLMINGEIRTDLKVPGCPGKILILNLVSLRKKILISFLFNRSITAIIRRTRRRFEDCC